MNTLKLNIGDEFIGNFFNNNDPTFNNYGELIIETTGDIKLIIFDNFITDDNPFWFSKDQIDCITAHVINKKTGTESFLHLYNLSLRKLKVGSLKVKTYYVQYILIGDCKTGDNDLLYTSINFNFKQFAKVTNHINLEKTSWKDGLIQTTENSKQILCNCNNYEITLNNYPTFNYQAAYELNVKFNFFLSIRLKHKQENFKYFISERIKLERFFTIYLESPIFLDEIILTTKEKNQFNLFHNNKIATKKNLHDTIINYLLANFETLWSNWLTALENEKYARLLNSFFFAYTDYKLDITNRFLNLTYAIEYFHDITNGKCNSFYCKLKQINDLFNKEDQIFSDTEISKLKDTRNSFVHLEPNQIKEVFTTAELFEINVKLITLLSKLIKQSWIEKIL